MSDKRQSVVVGLSGGLGNQMFQYAAGRSLAERLGVQLMLDLSWFGGSKERQFALYPFNINAAQGAQCPWLTPGGQALVSRISRRWLPQIMGSPVWREPHFHYSSEFFNLTAPVFLNGYWQSERYFWETRNLLLKDFSLRESIPPACVKLFEKIQGCDAICVHVRRGDYLSHALTAKVHGTVSLDYYYAGLEELCLKVAQPHCFVFSDDLPWARSTMVFNWPVTFVDVNEPKNAHLDLALMVECRHFLIANSSLSWWAAWLGSYADKTVIAPKQWFLTSEKDTRDLIPASWHRR